MSASFPDLPEFGQKNQSSIHLCVRNLNEIGSLQAQEKLVFHHDGVITKEQDSYSRSLVGSFNAWGSYIIAPSTSRDIRYLVIFIRALSCCSLKEGRSSIDLWSFITSIKSAKKGLEKLILTYTEQGAAKDSELRATKEAQEMLDQTRIAILDQKAALLVPDIDYYFSEFSDDLTADTEYLKKIAFVYNKTIKAIETLTQVTEYSIRETPKSIYIKAMFKFLRLSFNANRSTQHFALAFSEIIVHMFHPKKADILYGLNGINNQLQYIPFADRERSLIPCYLPILSEAAFFPRDSIPWEAINNDSPPHEIVVDPDLGSFVKIDE